MLQTGWFVLACIMVAIVVLIVGLVVHAYISSRIDDGKQKRQGDVVHLDGAPPPLVVGKKYHVQLSHGKVLKDITIVGMGKAADNLPWDVQHWLVGERADGTNVYLLPRSIRFVEDA
jgi:hypothetical protein